MFQFHTFENIESILNNDSTKNRFCRKLKTDSGICVTQCGHLIRFVLSSLSYCVLYGHNIAFFIRFSILWEWHFYRANGIFQWYWRSQIWWCAVLISVIWMFLPFLSGGVVWVWLWLVSLVSFCCHNPSGSILVALWLWCTHHVTSTSPISFLSLPHCFRSISTLSLCNKGKKLNLKKKNKPAWWTTQKGAYIKTHINLHKLSFSLV